MQIMKRLKFPKTIQACAVLLLLSACGVKTYKDLNLNVDTSAQVETTIGRPDAIETMPNDSTLQIWHYYDLALDLEIKNDTLRTILEASGMAPVGGKVGAAAEAMH
jgi:hypothetical protein